MFSGRPDICSYFDYLQKKIPFYTYIWFSLECPFKPALLIQTMSIPLPKQLKKREKVFLSYVLT